jgi:hypothetical protein
MVSGKIQTIDSAPVKANASMDSLELKVPAEELDEHIRKVRYMSTPDRKAKENKAPKHQKTITASERELKEIKSRNKKWHNEQDERPGAKHNKAKYTSNKTHYSPTDPDARISVKPGKARKLNYLSQMAVDTKEHVITHIHADYADKKDSQCLSQIVDKYHKEGDYWLCRNNKKVTFRKITIEKNKNNNEKKLYLTRSSDCKGCPYKTECAGKAPEKRITITIYKEEYERAIERINSSKGKHMKKKRQSTVEPVFGSLTNYYGMRKVNTIGIEQANKVMMMAATAYNIKKYLKFKIKPLKNQAVKALSSQNFPNQ